MESGPAITALVVGIVLLVAALGLRAADKGAARFGLRTLFAVVTAAAALLGIGYYSPGIAVCWGSVVAALWVLDIVRRRL